MFSVINFKISVLFIHRVQEKGVAQLLPLTLPKC